MPYRCNTGVVRSACRSLPTSTHLRSPVVILLRRRTRIRIHAQHKQGWCGVQSPRSATGVVVQGLADANRRTTPPQHAFAVTDERATPKPCWHQPRLSVSCVCCFLFCFALFVMLHSVRTYIALIWKIRQNCSGVRAKITGGRGALCNEESESAITVAVGLVVLAQYAVHDIPFRRTTVPERQNFPQAVNARTNVRIQASHAIRR